MTLRGASRPDGSFETMIGIAGSSWPLIDGHVAGRGRADDRATPTLVVDCHMRELRDRPLPRPGKATTAASTLKHAPITRFGSLGRVPREFSPRSSNSLIFTSREFTALIRGREPKQVFATPHCPLQNDMVE